MADHPGYSGSRRSSGGRRSGTGGGGEQTTQPGQYPPGNDHGIFGGALPTGTGAPGTGGGAGDGDPTTEAGQLSDDFTNAGSEVTNTGAPGSTGGRPSTGGGSSVTFTEPGSYLTGSYESDSVSGDVDGPGEWTEANVSGYGTSGPKLPGMAEPTSTGAGKGSVMRGGRSVR